MFPSDKDRQQILRKHFDHFYHLLVKNQFIPNAIFEPVQEGVRHCLSGIPVAYHNAVFGFPLRGDGDTCIEKQIQFFSQAKMPFIWCLDEGSSTEFTTKLLNHGFQDGGIFRAVIGTLHKPAPSPEIPTSCVLEQIKDATTMNEFNEFVCLTFGIQGISKELYKKVLWNAAQAPHSSMFHWVVKKQGKIVSALSTLIEGDVVSFWNGATSPEVRRKGFSTALRCLALKDALSRGCRLGASYLMSEAMALGICKRLGFQTNWKFHVFIAPAST